MYTEETLDNFYKILYPSTIQKVDSNVPTSIVSKLFIDGATPDQHNHRKEIMAYNVYLSSYTLERSNAPWIREIEQVGRTRVHKR